ncbi:MAG TPA: 3-deoxy-7-phosphoheptulonate synthase [Candidatus Dadabacteria bacterium]|nr:3-deoxy-7-phosphoheptulonate synthase [Candidatus Dadabacteria bacterium]
MIIVLKGTATDDELYEIVEAVKEYGYSAEVVKGESKTIIGAVGDQKEKQQHMNLIGQLPGVEAVVPILQAHKLGSREFKHDDSSFPVGNTIVGGDKLTLIAGPCSVESEEQIIEIAKTVKASGATILRGGAFKPRTSPYTFQGMGVEGLKLLRKAGDLVDLPIVTEVLDLKNLDIISEYADMIQIGARNCQNYALLKAVGKTKKPVLLKRGMSTSIYEFLLCAEYLLAEGNMSVALCERGIRTFETATRNTFDINAIPVLKERTHLPVIADPAHGTGYWQYVSPIAYAAIAAGADGLAIEVHNKPEVALSDGGQSLKPKKFRAMVGKARIIAKAIGKEL